jgi:hypothetical protein
MTLHTRVYLDGPVSGQEAFDLALHAILIAAGRDGEFTSARIERRAANVPHPYAVKNFGDNPERLAAWTEDHDFIGTEIGQGLPGITNCKFHADGTPLAATDQWVDDDADGEGYVTQRACTVEVSWDTAYSYSDNGLSCSQLHGLAIVTLHESLPDGVTMRWVNEYNGDEHAGISGIDTFIGDGTSAESWFRTTVLPIIEAEARR